MTDFRVGVLTALFVILTIIGQGVYLLSALPQNRVTRFVGGRLLLGKLPDFGKTVPHFGTWILMGAITGANCVLQVQAGAGLGAATTAFAAFMNFAICVVGFHAWRKYRLGHAELGGRPNVKHFTKLDVAALVLSAAATVFWIETDSHTVALLLLSLASLLAYTPTYRRSWHAPGLEPMLTYVLGAVRYMLAVGAVATFNLGTVFYPALWVLVNVSVVWLLAGRGAHIRRLSTPAPAQLITTQEA